MQKHDLRIEFEEAIAEPALLKHRWEGLSFGQRVLLKTIYGVPLDPKLVDEKGWSEIDYWLMGEGQADFDDQGYLTAVHPGLEYRPKRYTEAWIICGRRMGKSDRIASTVIAYEATCGGHEEFISSGQEALCFQIAQDMRMARNSMGFIQAVLEESPALKKTIKNKTVDSIELKTGITIAVIPPSLRSVRGYANPCTVGDEVGVWYQDADSANPDYEIYRAIKPGQMQFPNAISIWASSPWNKMGLLYSYYEAKTDGREAPRSERDRYADCLVWHSTSAGMGNPRITKKWLLAEQARDPKAFERECLAIFQDSISGFLSPALLREAVEVGCLERPPKADCHYVAAMDPAFKRDAFGFAICHAEEGVVFDVLRRWEPSGEYPLNPSEVLREISDLCRKYHIISVYTDQYHLESLQQLAQQLGMGLEGVVFTSQSKNGIYGSFQQLLNQRRVKLLDEAVSLRELRSIERTLTPGGSLNIQAPRGMHDDMATVIVLAAEKALWFLPDPDASKKVEKLQTIQEQIWEDVQRKREEANRESDWD